ncbi:cell shape-determining protein [Saccharomonospora sp. CUA-673]|uniref:arabinosyltransferase domain-containing protein n=1 Tax=Saccharomonospora sp. CUA-673 TaxID=1904969 RepID=UPI000963E3EB|nr:arabinosyltransferase domain-containing protein [Saccharomonospora sp. CUA-673]OLT39067.1 cell shape-determining protein [Saccharomonospora sp. CUA-673]
MAATATAPEPSAARRPWAVVLGLLSALAAVLFMLAPVTHDPVTHTWPDGSPGDRALPLLPYAPERLDVTFSCADLAALGPGGGTLVSTTGPGGEQPAPDGLAVTVAGDQVTVSLGDEQLVAAPRADTCAWTVTADEHGTVVHVDGERIGAIPERPAVNGLFTDATEATEAGDLSVEVTPDTRYESSPSALKIAAGLVALASLVGMLFVLRRTELGRRSELGSRDSGSRGRRVRLLPALWARPRVADAVVVGVLAVWAVIGASTTDDGYIVTMILSAEHTGFVGNYMRWFNAPEAPFSWFYELYRPWAEISTTTLWMRVPSLLLCLASWWIIDRLLLPRFAKGRLTLARWTAAGVFLLWTVQFGIGLRPEPWVLFGSLVTLALLERGIATRRLSLLAGAVVAAGATTTITPTGVAVAFQLLVALPAAWPVLRAYGPRAPAILLGAGASVLLLMFHGQPLDAVLHATQVRTEIGPSYGVFGEGKRYEWLFDQAQGGTNRRMPVLLLWFGVAVLTVLLVARRTPKLALTPTRRLLIATVLYFAALALTPTKYTHHFGALGGVGTLLVAVVVHTLARGALKRAWQLSLVCVALTAAVAIGLAAPLRWWFLGGLNVKWADVLPGVANIDAADMALVGGLAVALAGLVGAWRWLRTPAWFVPVVAFGVVGALVGTMAYAMVPRAQTYTTGASNLAALGGDPCGIERWLQVEPDIGAGVLTPSGPATMDGFVENGEFPRGDLARPYGSAEAPVWRSDGNAGSVTTSWYRLPDAASSPSAPPVVLPARGSGEVSLTAEFGDADGRVLWSEEVDVDPEWTDVRLDPGAAAQVRVTMVDERGGDGTADVGTPRLPEVVPVQDLVPASEPVLLDWVGAFTLPCRRAPSVAGGVVEPVQYRFASGPHIRAIASVSYIASAGGPYVPLMQLATETPVPTYLRGDKLTEPISISRLHYPTP